VNENDTVATEEIRFGDNDILAAQVAGLIDADLVVMLSDIDGLYDPKDFRDLAPIEVEDGKETYLGFGSLVAAHVRAGEHLLHFTQKTGPGPENDRIGAILQRPDVVIRHIISKTKAASENPEIVDWLMEAKIREALQEARAELVLVRQGHTVHPDHGYPLHSENQLRQGIDLYEENLDGRWRLENGRFVGGFWLYKDGRLSWHRERESGFSEASTGGMISFVSVIAQREGQEDRHVVRSVQAAGIQGDLLAVIDGHGDERVAQLIQRKLPELFEHYLTEVNGNITEALRLTDFSLDKLTKGFGQTGAGVVVAFMTQERVEGYVKGNPSIIVAEDEEIRYLSPEHDANNQDEVEAVRDRGGYVSPTGYFARAEEVLPYFENARAYGDGIARGIFSQEPEFFSIPLTKRSNVILTDDGVVRDKVGGGVSIVQRLVHWSHSGLPAEAVLSRRNDAETLNDNATIIVHQRARSVKDGGTKKIPEPRKPVVERYTAKDRDWFLAHRPLPFQISDTLRETSERMKSLEDEKEAQFLIFHGSILTEDLGEHFSLALDELAEATGNPLNNRESVFKIVLLIDNAGIKQDEVNAYLAQFGLRPEQFSAVVTLDQLGHSVGKGGYVLSTGRGTYLERLEEYLWDTFVEDNLDFRLVPQGKDEPANAVVVAQMPWEVEGWREAGFLEIVPPRLPDEGHKIRSRVKIVSYSPRRGEGGKINLASLLTRVAAETSVAEQAWKLKGQLGSLQSYLKLAESNFINLSPVDVSADYIEAYHIYERQF